MKGFEFFNYPKFRPVFLIGGLLLFVFLQACSTYSSSRGYSTRGYSYQPQISDYHRGHGYYGHRYYGNYQPGWFISAGYPGGYYGSTGFGPVAYWPSYSYAHYRNAYYPYYDPWYYSYSSHYRHPYSYGSGYWYGHPYVNRPYYGNSHSYRPPGQNQQPPQDRPDPRVIPPSERGRRGASDGYTRRVDEGLRQRETHQPDRRSVTVVNEEQGLSRSVGVAPTQSGDQGMSISSRSDRKVRASRLEPVAVGTQTTGQQVEDVPGIRNGTQRAYSISPVQRPVPNRSGRNSRAYDPESIPTAPSPQNRGDSRQGRASVPVAVPPARSEPAYRQAPIRKQPAYQAPAPRSQPAYEQRLDSNNVVPRADRRRSRETDPERDQRNR